MEVIILTSSNADGTAILRGHPNHAKVYRLQGKGSIFISQLFQDPEYCSGSGNRTHDLPLCSQALYRLSYESCQGGSCKFAA